MDSSTTKQRLFRLWVAFLLIWTAVFGYSALSARQAAAEAHDEAQGARVGGNLLRAGNPDLVQPDDPMFGDAAVTGLEAVEDRTQSNYETALLLLFGGLAAGTAAIGLFYWIMFGAGRRAAASKPD